MIPWPKRGTWVSLGCIVTCMAGYGHLPLLVTGQVWDRALHASMKLKSKTQYVVSMLMYCVKSALAFDLFIVWEDIARVFSGQP